MTRLFAFAIFLSATLLFMVQPLAGKIILPALGGSPAVWSVCMVFFQVLLLLGYLYAHALSTRVPRRWQGVVHVGLLVVAAATLPFPVVVGDVAGADPRWLVVRTLAMTVGLPFLALSASAPLLQTWFSRSNDPAARDPYFLYAASNAGSLTGLLAYPAIIEPSLSRGTQAWAWSIGLWVLIPVVLAALLRAKPWLAPEASPVAAPPAPVSPGRRLRWVALAATASALLLGVTQHLATDVVSAPFLWVAPLALYLLTFILAFARRPLVSPEFWTRAAPWAALAVALAALAVFRYPVVPVILLHLAAFGVLAMACHAQLAADRPEPARQTEFYLCLAAGGALGGAATALLAPVLFTSILEYPIAVVAAVLLLPQTARADAALAATNRWAWRGVAILLLALGWWGVRAYDLGIQSGDVGRSALFTWVHNLVGDLGTAQLALRSAILLPVLALAFYRPAAVPFAGALAGVLLGAGVIRAGERSLHRERTFFGVHEVASIQNDHWHILNHGTTMHGVQAFRGDKRVLPTMYYHPSGPIGDAVAVLLREGRFRDVGVVGLGSGALAAYADSGVTMDFFEIDPAVIRIARDARYFTYLSDAAARPGSVVRTVEGDGRLALLARPEASYDLLVIDAFSSDAIPTHLLTREAIDIYVSRLKPGGVVAFHVSSRYFDLRPVLARLAADRGLAIRVREDSEITPAQAAEAKRPSVWVVLARRDADFGPLAAAEPRWTTPYNDPRTPLWTDDYTNVLGALEGW